jgi:hypothetical protein
MPAVLLRTVRTPQYAVPDIEEVTRYLEVKSNCKVINFAACLFFFLISLLIPFIFFLFFLFSSFTSSYSLSFISLLLLVFLFPFSTLSSFLLYVSILPPICLPVHDSYSYSSSSCLLSCSPPSSFLIFKSPFTLPFLFLFSAALPLHHRLNYALI